MSKIDSYFADFLSDIRLTSTQNSESQRGHKVLRDRLHSDEDLKEITITSFLQGSYRRSTAVRPSGEKRADVDIIVVTNLDRNKVTPHEALKKFEPFVEKHYKGKWHYQGRSIGIELSYVDLDIVVTSAPSEVEESILKSASVISNITLEELYTGKYDWRLNKSWTEPDFSKGFSSLNEASKKEPEWKTEPLWIPDRDAGKWEQTHPLEQIRWSQGKNKLTNGFYVNVVKAVKWSRLVKMTDLKYPKGYPIEHAIGDCCPNDIESLAEGVTKTFEAFVSNYQTYYNMNIVPTFPDRGVPQHNVWKRITFDDFKKFFDYISHFAKIARQAMEEKSLRKQTEKWREIFGDKFPLAPDDGNDSSDKNSLSSFSSRTAVSTPKPERFA